MSTADELLIPKDVTTTEGHTAASLIGPATLEDPGYVEVAAQSLIKGGAGLVSGAGAAAEWAGDVTKVGALQRAGSATRGLMKQVVEGPVGKIEGPGFAGTFMEQPSVKRAFGIAVEATPSLIAAVGTGGTAAAGLRAAGMAAPKALRVGSAVAAGGLGLVEGAPQYIEAKEAGKSLGKASAIGAAATVGSAALEYLGISKILGMAGKGAVRGAGKGVITEGVQEGTQQLWQNIVAKVGYEKGRSLFEGMAESIIGGAGAGGAVGAVTGRATMQNAQQDRAAEQALEAAIPGARVAVSNGMATVVKTTEAGTVTYTAPASAIAESKVAGLTDEDIALANDSVKVGVAAAQAASKPVVEVPTKTPVVQAAKSPVVEPAEVPKAVVAPDVVPKAVVAPAEAPTKRLKTTDTALRFDIAGRTVSFTAPEGQTKNDLIRGIAGKSADDAVTWLKKNAITVGTEDVPAPLTADTIAPQPVGEVVATKSVTGAVTGVDVVATEKTLPVVPEGHVRLYRASSPTVAFEDVFDETKLTKFAKVKKGEEFYTSSLKYADYFRETYGADASISYVDVPATEAKSRSMGDTEYSLPVPAVRKAKASKKKEAPKKKEVKVETKKEAEKKAKEQKVEKTKPFKVGKKKKNGDPRATEARAITEAVEGHSADQVLDFLEKTGPTEAYREIAKAVRKSLAARAAAGMRTTVRVAYNNTHGPTSLRSKARGVHIADTGTGKSEVWLNDSSKSGRVGVSYNTLLHELTHAATALAYTAGRSAGQKATTLGKATRELDGMTATVQRYVETRRSQFTKGQIEPTAFEKRLFGRGTNALANSNELIAWGLTNTDMQVFLESVPSGKNSNMLSRFVSTVRKMLGLPVSADSALSEVLRISEVIMDAPVVGQASAALEFLQEQREVSEVADKVFSLVSEEISLGNLKVSTAAELLSNVKSKLHQQYVQHAPKWLAVTPLHTLTKFFGKSIPQVKVFADQIKRVIAVKSEIVTQAMEHHDAAVKLAEAGVGVKVLNQAAATSSFNQMTPWDRIEDQDWIPDTGLPALALKDAQRAWVDAGMQKATGLTYREAYNESKKSYEALKTKELQAAYRAVVEDIGAVFTREKNNMLAYIEMVSTGNAELRSSLMMEFNAKFSKLKGAYWPLSRFGKFTLSYKNKKGFRVEQAFDTIKEQVAAKQELLNDGYDASAIGEGTRDEKQKGTVSIPPALMSQLSEAVEAKYSAGIDPKDNAGMSVAKQQAQQIVDDMNQIWLRWQPETSPLKNSMRRGNVRGFSADMMRSYVTYAQKHASAIAWTEHGRKIEDAMQGINGDIAEAKKEGGKNTVMQQHVLNDLRGRINAIKSVSVHPVSSFIGKMSTGYYMTSPSIALVQMSQLAVLTLPKLSVMYSPVKAARAMRKATARAFSKKYTRDSMFADAKVNAVYDSIHATVTAENRHTAQAQIRLDGVKKQVGDDLFSDAQKLAKYSALNDHQKRLLVLRESMARNLLDISAAHEAQDIMQEKNSKSWSARVFKIAMMPMSLSELASRKTAILSTLDLAQGQKKDLFDTMDAIAEVVDSTLYSYAKEEKGRILQGGLARNLMQFQHYRMMTGLRMAMLIHSSFKGVDKKTKIAAQKEFIGIMGMTGLLAGAIGLPLSKQLFAILDLVLGDEDEPLDSELVFTNWLTENFGELSADVLAKGIPTLAGMDLSRRIGLADIYGAQNEPPPGMHGRSLAAWWVASQLGPFFSVTQGWVQGVDEMLNKGNYMKGLEVATPKPVRDSLKAYRLLTEGLKTSQGKRLLEEGAIGPDEVILTLLGFNADEVAKAQSAERSLRKLSTQISERRGRLARNAARAILDGGDTSRELSAIRAFNRKMPAFAIGGGDIRPTVRKILRGEYGATGKREVSIARQYEIPVYMR